MNDMTLTQVMESSRKLSIQEGGLRILLERIVKDIEEINIRLRKLEGWNE